MYKRSMSYTYKVLFPIIRGERNESIYTHHQTPSLWCGGRLEPSQPRSHLDCLLAVVFAESLAVLKSFSENFWEFVIIILALILCLAMLQQHLHLRDQQSICSVKIYTRKKQLCFDKRFISLISVLPFPNWRAEASSWGPSSSAGLAAIDKFLNKAH